tara:strand:- start:104 stop:940 length:837 start_codon:yes stop_codon:yes gene_type:complete
MKNESILVLGTVRNCEKTIVSDIFKLKKELRSFKKIHFLVCESDSSDNTLCNLFYLKNKVDNFDYISLGNLRFKIQKRTERIAYCRQTLINQIKLKKLYKIFKYTLISDLDGIIQDLSKKGIMTSFSPRAPEWAAVCANQDGPYFDIFALRKKGWIEYNCVKKYEDYLKGSKLNKRYISYKTMLSHMIKIKKNNNWIEVDSAFGGTAIYKTKYLLNKKYVGYDFKNRTEICEHVSLNNQIRLEGGKIFINPNFINTKVVRYTKNLNVRKFFYKLSYFL